MGCFVFTFLQAKGFFCNFFKQKLGRGQRGKAYQSEPKSWESWWGQSASSRWRIWLCRGRQLWWGTWWWGQSASCNPWSLAFHEYYNITKEWWPALFTWYTCNLLNLMQILYLWFNSCWTSHTCDLIFSTSHAKLAAEPSIYPFLISSSSTLGWKRGHLICHVE
jgi:hypothetical protein